MPAAIRSRFNGKSASSGFFVYGRRTYWKPVSRRNATDG
jgi:hypothetical protein